MKYSITLIIILNCYALLSQTTAVHSEKYRLIILADMGNEPDEMQQIIHMMTCSNEFDVEGLIAVTGKYLRPESNLGAYNKVTHPELFFEIINAYSKVYGNLQKHAKGWTKPEDLKKVVATGQKGYGIADVGKGKSSAGSKLIINAVTKKDDRLIWVVVNAGSNTLAQAIFDYKENHTLEELNTFISKLRVFENGSQDNAGSWICSQFPNIHWIRSNFQTYAYGGPGWADKKTGLGPHSWKPFAFSTQGQLDWSEENIMKNHGALGELYPPRSGFWGEGVIGFMEGGGTIPWMGLINKGLFDINQPSWGGWSGRFSIEKTTNFWSRHEDIKVDEQKVAPFYTYSEVSDYWMDTENDSIYANNYTPVWRWREAMYNDQICRMDWCVKDFKDANHHPIAAINGDLSNTIIRKTVNPEEVITLDASASEDPDGDAIVYKWWIYEEAGTYAGKVYIDSPNNSKVTIRIPTGAAGKQIHLILEIKDTNKIASLFDYRRIVFDVKNK